MKKFALITTAVLISAAAIGAVKKVATSRPASGATSRPSLAGLMAQAAKYESVGQYAQAAKSARAAIALSSKADPADVARIRKQLRRLARRLSSARRLEALTDLLARRPDDLAIREKIIRLCVLELDSPVRAAKFINEDTDQVFQTYVPMAARKLDQLAEAPCRELAEWYLSHLKKPSRFGRIAMLRRAAAYYGRFLQLHTSVDAEQRRAAQQYELVAGQLADLGESLAKAPS
ncbi:MAG: hypothetical protein QGG42_21285 [Phycisphaerae bacterium]|nr:hypothetical protein [Phycisphaerae bacterium]